MNKNYQILTIGGRPENIGKITPIGLQKNDDQFRIVFDNSALGIALIDEHGYLFRSNSALRKMLGYSARELREKTFAAFACAEDADSDAAQALEIIEGRSESYQTEKRFVKKTGEIMWGRLNVSYSRDRANGRRFFVCIVEDITQYRQAREALRESESRFRDFFENAKDVIYVHDLEGNYTSMNQTAEQIFGYTQEEILSVKVDQIVVPEHLEQIRQRILEKTDGGAKNTVYEADCITKDGRRLTLEVSSRAVYQDGVPVAIQGIARDITERKQTQEALRISEEQYRDLYQNANDLIYTHDLKGNFTSLNRAGELITGYTNQEAIVKNISDIVAPRLLETARQMIGRKIAGEMPGAYEIEVIAKDGHSVWLELNTRLIMHEGKPVGVQGIGRDITERRRSQIQGQAISEIIQGVTTTSNLDELYEHIYCALKKVLYAENCYVALYDEKTELLHIPFCRDQYDDAAPPQKLGRGLTSYVLRKGRPMLLSSELIEQLMAEGEVKLVGTPPAVWLGVPLRTPAGIIGVLVIQHYEDPRAYSERDLELLASAGDQIALAIERKRAGEQLRISAIKLAEANERAIREYDRLLQRLATLAQNTGAARDLATIFAAILDFARDSVPCTCLIISLYNEERSVRNVIYIWYHGTEVDISEIGPVAVGSGPVGQAIKSGEVIISQDYQGNLGKKPTNVYLGYEEDDREPLSALVAPMKIMGKAIGVIEIQSYNMAAYTQEHATAMSMAANLAANAIENVRLLEQERKRAEQLQESQKLESVGRLAGGIAHDFNNMLTAINGYSDLTLRRLPEGDPLRKNIEEIKKAGERSSSLTQQLLAFSRRQFLKPRVLDINHEINETGELLKRLIGEHIHLITDLSPDVGCVEADPGQLTQVIMNLAVNSRDAMPQGGELKIRTSSVFLNGENDVYQMGSQPGDYVMISVSDSGQGMSEAIQEHIFEPFYTTKEQGKGTGMGLATVYGIVKQSGGHISVNSEIGRGTTFKVYLPLVREKAYKPQATGTTKQFPRGTETILLVEDEKVVRNLSKSLLESCGYKIIEAANGQEGLSICQQPETKFDMLVTDVVMPKMSGRQLAEQVERLRPGTKILYMSGYTDDEVLRQGVVKAGENFVEKPFTFDTLTQKIRELLDS
jgi:PAS domain S-box-containing protein